MSEVYGFPDEEKLWFFNEVRWLYTHIYYLLKSYLNGDIGQVTSQKQNQWKALKSKVYPLLNYYKIGFYLINDQIYLKKHHIILNTHALLTVCTPNKLYIMQMYLRIN